MPLSANENPLTTSYFCKFIIKVIFEYKTDNLNLEPLHPGTFPTYWLL